MPSGIIKPSILNLKSWSSDNLKSWIYSNVLKLVLSIIPSVSACSRSKFKVKLIMDKAALNNEKFSTLIDSSEFDEDVTLLGGREKLLENYYGYVLGDSSIVSWYLSPARNPTKCFFLVKVPWNLE